MEKLHGKWAPLFVAALGVVLFLPLIGSFGLWDPHEVRVADVAKEIAAGTAKSAPSKPMLGLYVIVAGFKALGVGEVGGRVPVALVSILALLACFYAGSGLLRRRGALLGTLALATMPAFFLGARQLTSNAVVILAATLAVGGLGRAAWPRAEENDGRRFLHLGVGIVGLVLGYFSSGLMLGVAVPVTAVAVAVLITGGPIGAWAGGLVASVALWVVVLFAWRHALPGSGKAGGYSPILGGAPHTGTHQTQMVSILTQLGFGLFPWVSLLPLGAARAIATHEGEVDRDRFGRLALLAWALVAYLATTWHAAVIGESAFAAAGAVALLAGSYLDDVMELEAPMGIAALVAVLAAAVVAHDYFLMPEKMVGAHVMEGIKWPGPLVVAPYVILVLGLAWGGAVGLGLAMRPGSGLFSRQRLTWIGVGAALVSTLATTYWIVPDVSKHLSYKGLFTKYKALGGADGELGKYHVPGNLVYYAPAGKTSDLGSLQQMFEFLGKPARVFVMVSSEDLAPIDQHAKSQTEQLTYYVVDDSNSKVLLLSNRLGGNEKDLNPLKRQIVRELPKPPQHMVNADFEGKVELVGYDLPAELDRGRNFKITLYYKVKAPVEGAYKVFLHFDGPGTRFNGDHIPLEGRFPTNYWVPGFYIIDEHDMEPDRTTAPAGWYQIYSGMFMGDRRLKVVAGPSDGENRVKMGSVRVK